MIPRGVPLGPMADPTFAEKGELPQEGYVSHKRVGFSRQLLKHCSHPYMFRLNISVALLGTHECIAKNCVSKFLLLRFLWDFECRKNLITLGPRMSSLFLCSSHILVLPIFIYFLIELEC